MALTSMATMLGEAHRGGYAVGCFEVWDLYSMEAVVEVAEELGVSVIVAAGSLSVERTWLDAGGIESMGVLGRAVAQRAHVPVSLFLNEAHSYDQVVRGILSGFNGVMLASWELPFDENVRVTQEVVRMAHAAGAAVEGEVGGTPGDGTSPLTDPDTAARFVSLTGIDALAVSIGNVRFRTAGNAIIDLDLLERLRAAVSVPLAIHGGTGFPAEVVPHVVQGGVAKFNVGTALKRAFFEGFSAGSHDKDPAEVALHLGRHDDADALEHGKRALKRRVQEFIQLYGGA